MRILHVPYSFLPDPPGGTEIYVDSLVRWQRAMGWDAVVAAPARENVKYEHEGIPVWRFAVSPHLSLRDLYGEGDLFAAEAFGRIMDEFRPEVVHLHALTSAVSVRLAGQAASRNVPIVLNYHTPTVSCPRGTLLRWGTEVCDGALSDRVCGACVLQANGVPRSLAPLVQIVSSTVGVPIRRAGLEGGIWTALRMTELIAARIEAFHRMMGLCAHVVALCNWSRDLLLRNQIAATKITTCRQGIVWPEDEFEAAKTREPARLPLRLAFLGRFDSGKGVHILIEALLRDRELPVQLDLYGIRQGMGGDRYAARMRNVAAGDSRIRLLPPMAPAEVIPALRHYDALAVPSQLLETGPLVVLEAFAAGTPVVGSDLGGIAELVTDRVDGRLVRHYDSPAAWAAVLREICERPPLLDTMRAGIRPPRHARQSAMDLMSVYAAVTGKSHEVLPTA